MTDGSGRCWNTRSGKRSSPSPWNTTSVISAGNIGGSLDVLGWDHLLDVMVLLDLKTLGRSSQTYSTHAQLGGYLSMLIDHHKLVVDEHNDGQGEAHLGDRQSPTEVREMGRRVRHLEQPAGSALTFGLHNAHTEHVALPESFCWFCVCRANRHPLPTVFNGHQHQPSSPPRPSSRGLQKPLKR